MKLKTYNDLFDDSGDSHGCGMVDFERVKNLRKEAIKWVKELKDGMPKEAHIDVGRRSQKFTYCMCLGKIRWIMHFFNITEEDLK